MLEIIQKKLKELKLYEKNSKEHPKTQIDLIKTSIKEYGFNVPLVIDKDNNIIAGHGRYKAAQELNFKELPCIIKTDLTLNQIKAYRIADNKVAESDWMDDFLKSEITDLQLANYDLGLTGFSENELKDLFPEDNQLTDDGFIEVEAYERAKKKCKIKQRDIFQLGKHKLMCGDSTKENDVNKLKGENKPIIMVTDPPYGVNYNPKWRDEADKKGILGNRYPTRALGEVKNDDRIDWSEAYKLFEGDIVYIYHAGKYSGEVQKNIEDSGFEIINQIIWVKPHFALSRGDYHWKHEPIWYAIRKGEKHNWQGSRKEHTVWEIAGMNAMGASHDVADERTGHGTQKPIECMAKPIRNSTEENQIVYDPFGGSGSTLIAAELLNRICYMMELDEVYVQVIIDRWEKLTGKKAEKL